MKLIKFQQQQHFKSSTQHCFPCAINYDYIVKAETSDQDAEIIYEKSLIGTVPEARVPPRYQSSLKKPEMLYQNVSKELIEKIYHLYEDDFKLFGYQPDDVLTVAKEKRRRRSRPPIEKFSDLRRDDFEIFYPDIIN